MTSDSLQSTRAVPSPRALQAAEPALDRILGNADCSGGSQSCWTWAAAKSSDGYGAIKRDGRMRAAHREAYELLVGPIPAGLEIDHLCRNRACVNPSHMEPVTTRENNLRGIGPAATNARKGECLRGHAFDERNTRWRRVAPDRYFRICRTCVVNESRVRRAQRHAR